PSRIPRGVRCQDPTRTYVQVVPTQRPENGDIAAQLDEAARLLGDTDGRRVDGGAGSDRWRARAYREAARTVRALREPVTAILAREGREGLIALPAIGPGIAKRIEDMA